MGEGTLLIRSDASIAIGTGHAMRCLALAQAWQDAGGHVVFAMAEATPAVRARLVAESCEVVSISHAAGTPEDWGETIALARLQHAEWVVVDGYQFTTDYQQALKAAGLKILFLDDYGHASHYSADVVLNQNIGADEELYAKREPKTRLLLGPRYSLLRREFSAWREWEREIPPVARRVLVTMGGSDPQNVTARVIEALSATRLEGFESVIVAGGSNPRCNSLQDLANQAQQQSGAKITVRKDVSNMPELMAWADVAISAAGSTCWELCLLGLPSLLIDVAPNQTALAGDLGRLGCAVHLGDARGVSAAKLSAELERVMRSADLRRSLSLAARKLVDGFGAKRVISVMRGSGEIYLRRAGASDTRLLWEWANDPEVRAASFSSAAIPWETHVAWFEEKLRLPGCLILIAEDEKGTPVGQIRFDPRDDGDADVNVTLGKERRGRGLGVSLIESGIMEQFANSDCSRIHAFVKPENIASTRAFERAGFIPAKKAWVRGNAALHFTYARATIPATEIMSAIEFVPFPRITIGDQSIGAGLPMYVIAEISANHHQDFDQAVRIVHAAKASGANAVKLQTYTADTLTIASDREEFRIGGGTIWDGRNLHQLYSEACTPWEWQPKLKAVANELGMDLFSSPFDASAVDFLEEMGVPAHKLASFELVDIPLIQKMARTGKPLIMSTGMATPEEIEEALQAARGAGATQIALLKCTSAYPASAEEMHLRTIPELSRRFGVPVGLSDHTMGTAVPVAAVALGACIIEKHLTLSRSEPGPDSAFSLEPQEFKEMVDAVRVAEKALGEVHFGVSEKEASSRLFRRSLFVVRDVKCGEEFTTENIRSIRPGHGLHTRHLSEIMGQKAARDIERGTPMSWELVNRQ